MPPDDASQVVEAAELEVASDGTVDARDGAWRAYGAGVRFVRARRDPRGVWSLEGVEGRWGTLVGTAAGLRVSDSVEARELRWIPCACDDGTPTWWSLRAESARRDADGWTLRRPRLAIALPWASSPVELPLPDVKAGEHGGWRPDPPRLGRDGRGWRAEAGVRREEGVSTRTVGGWWRESRGAGLAMSLSGAEGGWFRAEGGIPLRNASPVPRGIAQGATGAAGSDWTVVAELDAASDAAWPSDMGEGWSARSVPWRESRALVRLGPARVAASSAGGVDARVAPASTWAWRGGGARAAAFAALGAEAGSGPRARAGARLTADLAPRWLDVHADAVVLDVSGRAPGYAGLLEAAVPGWVAWGGAPLRWALGGRVTHARGDAAAVGAPAWRIGPSLRVSGALDGWHVVGRGSLASAPDTWLPEARLTVRGPALRLDGRVDAVGTEGAAEVSAGAWRWSVGAGRGGWLPRPVDEVLHEGGGAWSGVVATDHVGWIVGGVGGAVGRFVLRAGVRASPEATAPEAEIAWDDGCTWLGVRGWWDPSAAAPGVALRIVPWKGAAP